MNISNFNLYDSFIYKFYHNLKFLNRTITKILSATILMIYEEKKLPLQQKKYRKKYFHTKNALSEF